MSEIRRKICFIAATLGKGGAEKQAYYLLKTLKENGHEVHVIYFEPEDWWKQPILDLGINVTHVSDRSKKDRIRTAYKLLKKEKPDTIQALHFHMNPYVVLLSLLLRAKSVGAFRGDGQRELQTVNNHIKNITFRFGNTFICNSRKTLEQLSSVGALKGKVHYLPNVVEVSVKPDLSLREKPLKFIAVNSLVKLKRVDRILTFFTDYKKYSPEAELTILGDGPLMDELKLMTKSLGIESDVRFLGQVDNVSDYYEAADVFLLASESEGTPNVILEAMSHAKVVISSWVGDAEYLLKNGEYGLLLDFDNKEERQKVCARLLSDWEKLKNTGLEVHSEIREQHSYNNLYSNVKTIYERIN